MSVFGPSFGSAVEIDRLRKERRETVQKLREICGHYGDNEWPDELHIADVLEKHLLNHLEVTKRLVDTVEQKMEQNDRRIAELEQRLERMLGEAP